MDGQWIATEVRQHLDLQEKSPDLSCRLKEAVLIHQVLTLGLQESKKQQQRNGTTNLSNSRP